MMTSSLSDLLALAARRTTRYDFTVWFWGDAIAMDGLMEAADLTGEAAYRDFCARPISRFGRRPIVFNDHLAPGDAILRLYHSTGDGELLALARRLADFLLHETPRSPVEGAPLYKPEQPMYRNTVYVDSIYHMPPFYAKLAVATGEERFFDEAVREWKSHVAVLSDARGPFLCHAFDAGYNKRRGYGWGRGSGWALLGMIDTLETLPKGHSAYSGLLAEMQAFAEEIRRAQDSAGFWRTLLQERDAYLESSTAAFFGAAFTKGLRLGLLGKAFAESAGKAWAAFLTRIDEEGGFFGVSACTWAGTTNFHDDEMYKTLPTEINVWGQGAALRFIAERLRAEL